MKKRLFILVSVLCVCLSFVVSPFWPASAAGTSSYPKNVIIFIGDGMGRNQVQAAHDYIGKNLNMEDMPYHGTSDTTNANGSTTDSAAGGTAIACGIKTLNDYVGVDTNKDPVENIREFLAKKGKKTGLVSTTNICDATPAAFGAHVESRSNQLKIAEEFINNEIDIIMGGGNNNFNDILKNYAKEKKGYTVITKKSELEQFKGDTKLLALFAQSGFPFYREGYSEDQPTLAEMTAKSIDILKNHPQGFFLMVEGAKIDHGGHNNSLDDVITETLEFDKAIKVAMDFAQNRGDTLIIVTADHETGGLKKEGSEYTFDSTWHTSQRVPVYAMGPCADRFSGDIVNTDICNKLKEIFNEQPQPSEPEDNEQDPAEEEPQPTVTPDVPKKKGCKSYIYISAYVAAFVCLAGVLYLKKRRIIDDK